MNSAHLTKLALSPDDRWTTKSTVPHVVKWTVADGVHLEDEDRERVRAMVEECGFTQTAILSNFDARLKSGLPPTGYAATWHQDSIFVADAFDHNVFRGVAGISLKRVRPPERMHAAFADLNAVFGDASPVPLVSRTQKGNWVCSLGSFGWVGLYNQPYPKPSFVAVVVAGLDSASWGAFRKEMREEMHRVKKVDEVFPKFEFWRKAAKKNRERVLATFVRLMNETTHDVGKMLETTVSYESRTDVKHEDGIKWFKTPHVRVPTWFVFPSIAPRGCDPLPLDPGVGIASDHSRTEAAPWEVSPEFDVVVDDLVRYSECEYVRLAGCCDSRGSARVVLHGPMDEILLMETPGEPNAETLNAYVSQAIQRPSPDQKESDGDADDDMLCTWEDPSLHTNRLVSSVYSFHTSLVRGDEHAQRLNPICVRVSCRDSTNRAWRESPTKNRLASLAMDDWDPIRR